MKKKTIKDDLEIIVDPKPLTKEEEIALSVFIKKLKAKKSRPSSIIRKSKVKVG